MLYKLKVIKNLQKFSEEKFFIYFLKNRGQKIANKEIIEEIQKEIERLK